MAKKRRNNKSQARRRRDKTIDERVEYKKAVQEAPGIGPTYTSEKPDHGHPAIRDYQRTEASERERVCTDISPRMNGSYVSLTIITIVLTAITILVPVNCYYKADREQHAEKIHMIDIKQVNVESEIKVIIDRLDDASETIDLLEDQMSDFDRSAAVVGDMIKSLREVTDKIDRLRLNAERAQEQIHALSERAVRIENTLNTIIQRDSNSK